MARQTLEGWLLEAMTDEEKGMVENPETKAQEPVKCYRIALMHLTGLVLNEVHTIDFGAKSWTPKELEKLFRGKAESFAQDLPGAQTFKLLAFYGTSAEPQAAHPFLIEGQTEHPGITTEGPNGTGVVQQAMRHLESRISMADKAAQVAFQNIAQASNAWAGVAQMMAGQVVTLTKENNEVMTLFKQMTIEKAAADHSNKMAQLEFERKTAERRKLMTFVPVLANTVAGREVFPQSTADTALVEAIIDKFSLEEIAKLGMLLPPEVMGPLSARAEKRLKEQRQLREEAEVIAGVLPKQTDDEMESSEGLVKIQ